MKATLPVEHISDTAFLTAFYRAMETERPDAHFRDPYARLLAGARGEQFAHALPGGIAIAPGCVVRTCVMDELILRTIQQDGVDTILNLGAGLDTRPYRLPLPASLHWIEVDLPVVLDYKASKLSHAQPTCGLESIALDLSDAVARRALLRQITGVANQVLVLTEGVLAYMTAKQVAELAIELHAQPQLGWWLIDLFSPQALHLQQQHLGQTLPGKTVNLQFAPPEGIEFFQTSGWQAIETRSSFAEGQRLQRGALSEAVLAQLSQEQLQILHQLCRFVLLARVNESSN